MKNNDNLKMRSKNIVGIGLILAAMLLNSCEKFLDESPDNRTLLNSKDKIAKLLVSAYPKSNYAKLAELSSDNFVDNNAPTASNNGYDLPSFSLLDDQYFAWQPATASTQQDSPSYIWENCYQAIAAANHALVAIDALKAAGNTEDMSAQKGEALLCRAYGHFVLVNIFAQAYKDSIASLSDLGIPYSTEPEKVVHVNYSRENVTAVYTKIAQDIEAGYPLLIDEYSSPKYHFNKKAAAAFAARFYLYKRDYEKVVKYANLVLTSSPAAMMRDWSPSYENPSEISYAFIDAKLPCNLLVLPTYSLLYRTIGTRYSHNGDAMKATTYGYGPTWNSRLPAYEGKLYIVKSQDYGVFFPKCTEMFEYTDKIAGIGFAHIVKSEFTAEETLLCRAEALIYLNRTAEAVADLQVWNKSHLVSTVLTDNIIKNFYVPANTLFYTKLNPDKMSASFSVTTTQDPYIQCALHFRRIETIFDGQRWFDVKRYGIEIKHAIGRNQVLTLTANDPRRAIQLPAEVISSGMEPNPSTSNFSAFSNISKLEQ
jgi:hypothetical protein